VVRIHAVARELALALADRRVRADLLAALKRSRVHEGKLHLQKFLKHRGASWGARVSEVRGHGPTAWRDAVNSLGGLEMYLPVDAHRASWKGTDDILVLGEVRDEAVLRQAGGYTAYDVQGNSYQFAINSPPTRPVLSLVPQETSFSADGEAETYGLVGPYMECQESCGGGGGGGGGGTYTANPGDSLVLYQSWVSDIDQYEGFGAGDPEFMVVLKAYNPTTGRYSQVLNCAGQDVYPPRGFNQDNNTWTGRAHMGSRAVIESYIGYGRAPMFYVWEDDSGEKCDFTPSDDNEYKVAAAAIAATGAGITSIIKFGSALSWAYTVTSAVMAVVAYWHATSGDDFIGIASVPKGGDPATNPKTIMHGDFPKNRGYLYMQFRPGN
jgi:hypothetical protein